MTVTAGHYRFGPDSGRLLIRTSRVGLAALAGHDLTLEVIRWSALANVPAEDAGGLAAATITAEADLGSLAVREGYGGAKPLTQSDRTDIEKTASRILTRGGAAATFTSSKVVPAGDGGTIEGTLTLHGRSQPIRFQVTAPEPGRYRGTGTALQSAFGIKPYTAFFGALKLADEVSVEFDVDVERASHEEGAS